MSLPRRAASAIVLSILVGTSLYADYAGSFKNGVASYDRKRWAEAARLMREAIAANPNESGQKILIYGTRYVEYTPHLYLAAALAKVNDCAGAVEALRTSEQQGVAMRLATYRQIKGSLAECEAQSAPQRPSRPVEQPPATTTTQRPEPAPVELPRLRPQPAPQPQPPPIVTQTTAPGPVPRPSPPVTSTVADLPVPVPAKRPADGSSVIDRVLIDAIPAYVRGDYGRVLRLLDGASLTSDLARAQAALFRSASRYALYVVGGGNDTTMRTAALKDLREYRRLGGRPPDVRIFAPPFRRFYSESTR